ncbi:sigma factor-like helix-turn-helix DNA-binding protein [Sorangium sp. So ce321]|uniref:RNA polymerase sigma factor n=1 Tax=Sorangium sp. So ce321 TaxID=3133300 RepID=UPI003F5DC587
MAPSTVIQDTLRPCCSCAGVPSAPALDPDRLARLAAPSPEDRLVARGLLRAFHRLRPALREILALAATGLSMNEIAQSLALPRPTVATRLRLARRLFARSLTRWRRWPR